MEGVAAILAERGGLLGRPLCVLATTTSTSDEARIAAKNGAPHGATWIAEQQTAGRGRRGRVWFSPPGEGLALSVLVRVSCPPARLPALALLSGLAVRDAVTAAAPGAAVRIKWPNDVVVGGRKLAGVLVEAATLGPRVEAAVVGIGINVHTRSFPSEFAERATSVALLSPERPPDRGSLVGDVLSSLDRDLHVVLSRGLGPVRARLEAADALRGRRVRSDSGDEGIAGGIDDEGRLLIQRDDGSIARWSSSEVHLQPAS